MSTKQERAEFIRKKAEEFALSGEYEGWRHVEIALRGQGFDEARSVLDSVYLRDLLDRQCAAAKKRKADDAQRP